MRGMSSSLVLCLIWHASVFAKEPLDLTQLLADRYHPTGIAVSGDGSVYLGASKPNVSTEAIFKFGPDGEQLLMFPRPEAPPEAQINFIRKLEVDAFGRVYAYDGSQREFKVFGSDGAFLSNLPLPADVSTSFDMAVGPQGDLHLLTGDSVRVYDTTGTLLRTFGQSGPPEAQLREPLSVEIDGDGYVYVTHLEDERVFVGGPPLLSYEFARSVKVFSPLGEFAHSFPAGSTVLNRYRPISASTDDGILISNGVSGTVERYSRDGTLEATAYGIPAVRQMGAASDGSFHFLLPQNEGFVQSLTPAEFDSRRVGTSSYFDYVRSEYQLEILDEAGIGRNNVAAESFAQTFVVPGNAGEEVELEFAWFDGGGGYRPRFGVFDRSLVAADPLEDPTAFMLEAMDARIMTISYTGTSADRSPRRVTLQAGTDLGFFLFPDIYQSIEEDIAWVQRFVDLYGTKGALNVAKFRTNYPFFSIAEANYGRVDQFVTFLGDDRTVIAMEDLFIRDGYSINFTDMYVSISQRLIPVPEPLTLQMAIIAALAALVHRRVAPCRND